MQLHVQVSISYFKYLFFSENSFFSNMSLQSLFVHYIKQTQNVVCQMNVYLQQVNQVHSGGFH